MSRDREWLAGGGGGGGGWGCWFWDFLLEFVNHWEVWSGNLLQVRTKEAFHLLSFSMYRSLPLSPLSVAPTGSASPTLFLVIVLYHNLFKFLTTSPFSVGQFLFSSFFAFSFPPPLSFPLSSPILLSPSLSYNHVSFTLRLFLNVSLSLFLHVSPSPSSLNIALWFLLFLSFLDFFLSLPSVYRSLTICPVFFTLPVFLYRSIFLI
jgi:hypothetical protein